MIELASLVGQTLDSKYQLEEQLGQGGMGTVFRATHLGTDRVVALKLIAPGLMDQEDFVQRFQREARATGRLRHPNIVDLTDFGFAVVEGKKLAYLVMEFLEGESLSDLLKRNPTPPLSFVVEVVQQVCSALQEANDKGIVHRDLKPDNLWLEPDRRGGQRVKIMDFGLAKIYDPKARAESKPGLSVEDTVTKALAPSEVMTEALHPRTPANPPSTGPDPLLTEVGTCLGTPAYMSPEQCRGVALDHRSDLYSLGVIIYQMLSGRMPFQGGSLDLINAHIQSEAPDLRELRKDLPPGVANLVMECLAKDPRKRPENAEILGNALEAFAEDLQGTLKRGFGLYVDLFMAHWRGFLVPFFPAFFLAILLLAYAWHLEAPLGQPGGPVGNQYVRMSIDIIAYWASLAWVWFGSVYYGFLSLTGSVTPLVLRRLMHPLAAQGVDVSARDREALRAYGRFALLGSLPLTVMGVLMCLDLGWSIKYVAENRNASPWFGVSSMGFLVLLIAGMIIFNFRVTGLGYGGERIASAIFLEGIPIRQARTRIKYLVKKVAAYIPGETWEWRIRRTRYAGQRSRVAAGPGNLLAGFSGLAVGTSVCVGLKIWDRFLPQELHYGVWAFAAWGILWCTLLLSLLAPLSAIFSALAYLRLRKIARESMAEAYKNFEARLSGKSPKEGV